MGIHRWLSQNFIISRTETNGKYRFQLAIDFPVAVVHYRIRPMPRLIPNWHDHLEIGCRLAGRSDFQIGDKEYRVEPGDVVLVDSHTFHRTTNLSDPQVKGLALYFHPCVFNDHDQELMLVCAQLFRAIQHEARAKIGHRHMVARWIHQLVREISRELDEKRRHYQLAVRLALAEIILLLCRHYPPLRAVSAPGRNGTRRMAERLEPVIKFLSENYGNKISLPEMARLASFSVPHFVKVFKKLTGLSLIKYLNRLRVEHAEQILLQTDSPVADVAYQVGFQSQSYFDRVFRRLKHVSPSEFRKATREPPGRTVPLRQGWASARPVPGPTL